MIPRWLLPALAASALGCSDPPAPAPADAATDAAATDAAATDAAIDAAPADVPPVSTTVPYTCMPCQRDADCGDEALCAEVDRMRAPGFRECRLPCAAEGAPCAAAVPAACAPDRVGRLTCTPEVAFGCVPMGSRRGETCPSAGCLGRYARCARLDDPALSLGRSGPVCLAGCTTDADCEDGARRCREVPLRDGARGRVCLPDPRIGPEACGAAPVNLRGIGGPCGGPDGGLGCSAGLTCLAGVDPAVRPFCTAPCTADTDCGDGPVRCLPVAGQSRCVPTDCACLAGTRDALIDRALAADPMAPATRCDLFFSGATLDAFGANVARDRYRLPVFDRVHRDWLAGAAWARDLGPALDRAATSLARALAAAASLRHDGSTTAVPVPAPQPPVTDGALVAALADWITYGGATPDRPALTAAAAALPSDLGAPVARILAASLAVARARDAGLAAWDSPEARDRLFRLAPTLVLPGTSPLDRFDFTSPDDLGLLRGEVTLPTEAALALAATVESIDWAPLRNRTGPNFSVDTPAGQVIVRDAGAHRYTAAEFARTLLVIDLGGDDTYEAPVGANQDARNPVSVLVDLGGDDTYGYPVVAHSLDTPDLLPSDADGRRIGAAGAPSYSRTARQGAGRLGVGLLYDLGTGRDRYRGLRMSQGFGALGLGGLYDEGGDDTYEAEAGAQGAAMAGLGVLVDGAGRDTYTVWSYGQGFGYVQGVGLVIDRDGDDRYTARVTPVLYPSPQSPMSNTSFAQGAGFGRRGDAFPDRINMSGGIGILRDRTGSDQYTAGVFGQGTGYWGGMGLLLDGAGDDRYDGRWYVQAGSAHFAYAALVDGGGRDDHNALATRQNMTAGAGHDFSLSVFLAQGPEGDTYRVPNLALGAGNANGAGIFADEGGDDTYEAASALTLGNAALESLTDPGRLMRPTVGLFLDADGRDTYTRSPAGPVGNDRTWTQRIHPEAPSERGFGADATGARTGLEAP